jgi:hypothetical protein
MKYMIFYILLLLPAGLYAQDANEQDEVYEEEYPDQTEETLPQDDAVEETVPQDSDSYVEGYDLEGESDIEHVFVKPTETSSLKEYQSEKVYHKTFDESKWRKVVGDRNYKEEREAEKDTENFRLPSLSWGGELLKAIGYTLVIGLVILILYLVFKNIKLNQKSRFGSIAPFAHHDDEDIRQMDLAALLKQAMEDKNFKAAVRFYYLSLLKNLHDTGMIKWEKDKTNRDYLSELFSKNYHYDEVKKLTRGYEEVWYGDHHFPDHSLLSLISQFELIHTRINPPKAS